MQCFSPASESQFLKTTANKQKAAWRAHKGLGLAVHKREHDVSKEAFPGRPTWVWSLQVTHRGTFPSNVYYNYYNYVE